MKLILLGVGMQGKAALYDLVQRDEITEIIAADLDIEALQAHVDARGYGRKVHCAYLNAADPDNLDQLLGQGADVILQFLPKQFINTIANAAMQHGIHLVFTSYITPELKKMAAEIKDRNITILPEFGLDPGIDLVLLGHAVRSLDRVTDIFCYGAGFPEADAANNPVKYKISWTFSGVLKSYRRAGRIIRDGALVNIGNREMFAPEHVHRVNIPGIGSLEAFPNGDALPYADLLDIDHTHLRNLGRFAMRWPGHSAFWKALVDLHLLDSDPVLVDGVEVHPQRFLAATMAPYLQYRNNERDITVVRVEVKGQKYGENKHLVYQMIDKRDLKTGFMAMNRTVGFTASIGALLIGSGKLTKRGLLSPVNDIPFDHFVLELADRNIKILREEVS